MKSTLDYIMSISALIALSINCSHAGTRENLFFTAFQDHITKINVHKNDKHIICELNAIPTLPWDNRTDMVRLKESIKRIGNQECIFTINVGEETGVVLMRRVKWSMDEHDKENITNVVKLQVQHFQCYTIFTPTNKYYENVYARLSPYWYQLFIMEPHQFFLPKEREVLTLQVSDLVNGEGKSHKFLWTDDLNLKF